MANVPVPSAYPSTFQCIARARQTGLPAPDVWRHLQAALAWMHLEDLAFLEPGDDPIDHPVRRSAYGLVRDLANAWKGRIPFLLGLAADAQDQDIDFVEILSFAENGDVPLPGARWTDPFLRPSAPFPIPQLRIPPSLVRRPAPSAPRAKPRTRSEPAAEEAVPPEIQGLVRMLEARQGNLLIVSGGNPPDGVLPWIERFLGKRARFEVICEGQQGTRAQRSAETSIRSGAVTAVLLCTLKMKHSAMKGLYAAMKSQDVPYDIMGKPTTCTNLLPAFAGMAVKLDPSSEAAQ